VVLARVVTGREVGELLVKVLEAEESPDAFVEWELVTDHSASGEKLFR
jgi:hypothetical protein